LKSLIIPSMTPWFFILLMAMDCATGEREKPSDPGMSPSEVAEHLIKLPSGQPEEFTQRITVNEYSRIELKFMFSDLGSQIDCSNAWVMVVDSDGSELLGKSCNDLPDTIISNSNQIFIKFRQNSALASNRYEAKWKEIGAEDEGLDEHDSEWFYIINPASGSNKAVTIAGDGGLVIDKVVAGSGSPKQQWMLVDNILVSHFGPVADISECLHAPGVQVQTWDMHGGLNQIFTSGDNNTIQDAYGLVLRVNDYSEVVIATKSVNGANQEFLFVPAAGVNNPTNGVITSPNWPEKYPHNYQDDCQISVEDGFLITLKFTDFEIENYDGSCSGTCSFDWVTVVDGDGTELLPRSCCQKCPPDCGYMPPEITSKTNTVIIKFKSDDVVKAKGFRLIWTRILDGPK